MPNDKWISSSISSLLNVSSRPLAPAEPLLGEISAPQCHNGRAAGFHYDGRHVVPVWFLRNVGNPAIDAGRPDDLALFADVHGGLGLSDLVARTGFDFDEGQREWPRRFVVGDDVDLPVIWRPSLPWPIGAMKLAATIR